MALSKLLDFSGPVFLFTEVIRKSLGVGVGGRDTLLPLLLHLQSAVSQQSLCPCSGPFPTEALAGVGSKGNLPSP